ncbi:MAG TPA: sirohydrochlorin chelatase [Chthonomonadales bacterium]|nr:sirohydrochlorin chelatase [Chthonomonadales bacterium]
MDAVVLFSHGSVLCGAGQTLEAHCAGLRSLAGTSIVEYGYLNYSRPSFFEAVGACVNRGARRILVAPYFLSTGKFISEDVPAAMMAAQQRFPAISLECAPPLGYDVRLADAIEHSAAIASPPSRWHQEVDCAAAHCLEVPTCPLFGTGSCPGGSDGTGHREQPARDAGCCTVNRTARGDNRTLLIMAHGSPIESANEDIYRLARLIDGRSRFRETIPCFLECNRPNIGSALAHAAGAGASEVVAVPFFLHTGRHVALDIPALMRSAAAAHPQVDFYLGDYIGRSEKVTEILMDRIREANARPAAGLPAAKAGGSVV